MTNWRAALFVVAMLASPAQAECLIFCDPEIADPKEAEAAFVKILGSPLPDGVSVVKVLSGGFQERFVQIRIEANMAASLRVLAQLGVSETDLQPRGTEQMTLSEEPWWTVDRLPDVRVADATLGHFAVARVAVAPAPMGMVLFILAHET